MALQTSSRSTKGLVSSRRGDKGCNIVRGKENHADVDMAAIYESVLRVSGKLKELNVITGFITVVMVLGGTIGVKLFGLEGIGYSWLLVHVGIGSYAIYKLKTERGVKRWQGH